MHSVSTVDSTPTSHSPPSTIASTRPVKSSTQCRAQVGLGEPERFADGAASGTPARRMSSRATGWAGMRTATVSSPPDVSFGTRPDFGRMTVIGPGQNCPASRSSAAGSSRTSGATSSSEETCTMSGLSLGRPLAA